MVILLKRYVVDEARREVGLSDRFNITKAQLQNAIQVGHKNNLRDKAAKSVR